MSTAFPAFQGKVNNFWKWGANKRCYVSGKKSKWMIFGPLPPVIPTLWCGDIEVELVFEFKYVGIWFTSIQNNVLATHYAVKASKARGTGNAAFALKHRIGSLPVREGLVLYMARVDCYLISGAELALDTDPALLHELQDVQHTFLRRLLGLNARSMLAVLFTETGQMPIGVRRLLRGLSRLRYMLGISDPRVVQSALLDSVSLAEEGKSGWAGDLLLVLSRLPTPILLNPRDLLDLDTVEQVCKDVETIVNSDLQLDIDRLVKTHLLRNRLDFNGDKQLTVVTRRLRFYLTDVVVPAHRKAITGLLLGDHNLSVERLRYGSRYRNPVPRRFRLCRFCRSAVEDEAHALFGCDQEPRLLKLREEFLVALERLTPELRLRYGSITSYEFLLSLVSSHDAVKAFARYIYLILSVYQETAAFVPLAFKISG
ncbi:reverse transcriptase domain-containing protein [Favolaschia claudopus]|uniref:Reverse transcriptase domain-containing protein n=1 Tax=Favolaschia claudopus TaxID=2862362 RepID=A0AAW0AWY9_9AGAR